jgi:hypothetical protein
VLESRIAEMVCCKKLCAMASWRLFFPAMFSKEIKPAHFTGIGGTAMAPAAAAAAGMRHGEDAA